MKMSSPPSVGVSMDVAPSLSTIAPPELSQLVVVERVVPTEPYGRDNTPRKYQEIGHQR